MNRTTSPAGTNLFYGSATLDKDLTRGSTRMLVALCLALAGCSQPMETQSTDAQPAPTPSPAAAAPSPAEHASRSAPAVSRVLAKEDVALHGKPACRIGYLYAGHAADTLFWEEPCAATTAKMMTRSELVEIGKWDRLDDAARTSVAALPGGKVLYVEGGFSASVYPIGTTGSAYEVPVAD